MENVKKFYEALSKDAGLKSRADALNAKYKDALPEAAAIAEDVAAFAKTCGFEFTTAELTEYGKAQNRELRNDELEAVAGGGACACVGGGYGSANPDARCASSGVGNNWCQCAIVGYGGINNDCFCFFGGGGNN